MNDPLDVLISRHLDGTAAADDVRRLDERLKEDPTARHALLVAAAQDMQLREILAVEPEQEALDTLSPRRWRIPLAAAAAVLLVAGGLAFLVGRYPAPVASGSCQVVGGGEIRRGAVIATDSGRGTVTLGGYCRVQIEAGSTVRVEGEKYEEQVFLERGHVVCEADRGVGKFTVRTEVGAVAVKGTKFTVRMADKQGAKSMFDKRMAVAVLTGTVLVSGPWGEQTLRAGQEAILPPPGTALQDSLAKFDLPADVQKIVDRILSPAHASELRSAYRTEVRGRLFDTARRKLQASMPTLMPAKVSPKVRAIRSKARAGGPPSAADLALIRLASQKRAREVMMDVLHETANTLADEAATDDYLIAWLLAKEVRAKLPGERITAFDKAVNDAGMANRESQYLARAAAAIEDAIKAYDPDLTGIVDPATGKVIVSEEELGVPTRDEALARRVSQRLRAVLADVNVPAESMRAIEPLLTLPELEGARLRYCTAARSRLFEAARKKQASLLPQKMPLIVQSKVMAIRTRVQAGGPPSSKDIARIQRAVMQRTCGTMKRQLHDTADAVAAKAAKDERLVAGTVARTIRAKLASADAAAFDAALANAGITGDESAYMKEAEDRIASAIEALDPDLSGIVSPTTGAILLKD